MTSLSPVQSFSSPQWPASVTADSAHCDEETTALHRQDEISPVTKSSTATVQSFDDLIYEVLALLIQEEEKATVILRDAIVAEREWQKNLSTLVEKEHELCQTYEKRNDVAHKIADIVLPASLCAEGIAAMCLAGVNILTLGAAALGGLLVLDTLLGDKAKEMLASFLGRGTEEGTKSWLHTISMTTSIVLFGLGFLLPESRAVQVATTASKVALECTQAGTEMCVNGQKARLIESEKKWSDSGECMSDLLGYVDRHVRSVNDLYELLSDLHKSEEQATAQIFRML